MGFFGGRKNCYVRFYMEHIAMGMDGLQSFAKENCKSNIQTVTAFEYVGLN
jgi:hypothetical protein